MSKRNVLTVTGQDGQEGQDGPTFHGLDDLKLLRQEGLKDAGAEGEFRQVGERGNPAAHWRAAPAAFPIFQRLQLLLALCLEELALAQEVLAPQREAVQRSGQVVSSWGAWLAQSHLLPKNIHIY